jgi:hypothetical protein
MSGNLDKSYCLENEPITRIILFIVFLVTFLIIRLINISKENLSLKVINEEKANKTKEYLERFREENEDFFISN